MPADQPRRPGGARSIQTIRARQSGQASQAVCETYGLVLDTIYQHQAAAETRNEFSESPLPAPSDV